jgi:endonuclease YncB( thermonuclease family)
MNRLIVLALLLSASCSPSNAAEDTSFSAKARALDGDTVATDFRLLGVDAFERHQLCERAGACWECGKAAQDLAARTLGAVTRRSSSLRTRATAARSPPSR